jgi:hypothetical protein
VSTARVVSAVTVSVGAALALVGTFLTWIRSGAVERSSYEIFDLVGRLGFSPDGAVGWAVRLWPLVPLLLVLSVVCWWSPSDSTPLRTTRIVLPVVVALWTGGTGLAIATAPQGGLMSIGPGPSVTAVGAAIVLAGAAAGTALSATDRGRSGRPSAPAVGRS